MRVLVAGATGTLGQPLVRELITRGHQVTGLTRTPEKISQLEGLGAQPAVCDVLDAEALTAAVLAARPEAIVHAATAIPKRGPTRPKHLDQTNILRDRGTENLVLAAREAHVERLLAESMVFIYGLGDSQQPVGEEQPAATGLAGRQQAMVDALVSLERQVLAVPGGVVLRYGLFHGPGAPSSRYMLQLASRRMLPIIGEGEGVVPWIDVDDAAAATADALERAPNRSVYNVVDDEPVRYADYVRWLARTAGAKPPRRIPLWLGKLMAPQAAEGAAVGRLVVSNARIKQEIGWTPQRASYRDAQAALVESAEEHDPSAV